MRRDMNRRGALLAFALLLAVLLAAPAAYAQATPAQGPCLAVEELNLYDPDRSWVLLTTPPYVALAASGSLKRLARRRPRPLSREVALSDEQAACLKGLTGARMTAVRVGSSYRYKLQTAAGTLLIFHVADLVGSEAIVPTQAERLLAVADRFLKEGNCAEAAKAYREALKAEPRPAEAKRAHTALGKMEAEEGPCKAVEVPLPALEEEVPLPALEEEAPLPTPEERASLPALEVEAPGPFKAIMDILQVIDENLQNSFDRINPVTAMLPIRLALMGLIFLTLSYSFIYRRVREERRNVLVVIFLFISSSVAYMIPLEWIRESLHPGNFYIIGAVSSVFVVAIIPYTVTEIPHKQKLILRWLIIGLVILLTGPLAYDYYAG